MDDRTVANGDLVSNDAGGACVEVEHGVVLNV
jgi:hypothetical protein